MTGDGVVLWTCPACHRRFGRTGQAHECAPAITLQGYFSTGPARERPIFEAVMRRLDPLGPVHVEPVSVGILLKRTRSFAELRPMVRWEALWLMLPRVVVDPRISRTVEASARRVGHVIRLYEPEDVDEDVGAWLAEAYLDG